MSDREYHAEDHGAQLRAWGLARTMEGASWGLAACLGFAAIYGVIWVIGELLPEQSKQAPPPNVTGALIQPLTVGTA